MSYMSNARFLSDIPPIWRLDPGLEVAHKASLPVLDRRVTPECLIEGILCMARTYEVV